MTSVGPDSGRCRQELVSLCPQAMAHPGEARLPSPSPRTWLGAVTASRPGPWERLTIQGLPGQARRWPQERGPGVLSSTLRLHVQLHCRCFRLGDSDGDGDGDTAGPADTPPGLSPPTGRWLNRPMALSPPSDACTCWGHRRGASLPRECLRDKQAVRTGQWGRPGRPCSRVAAGRV